MKKLTPIFVILLILSLLVGNVGTAKADSTVVVTPTNMGLWLFHQFAPTGTGEITNGPGTPPLWYGSARLTTSTNGGMSLQTTDYSGIRLDSLTRLEYGSYRATSDPNNNRTVAVQLEMDYDIDDPTRGVMGWLVFEPYKTAGNGSVAEDTWYTWNALTGKWYASVDIGTNLCTQSNPCTITELLTVYPDAGVRHNGDVRFAAGSNWNLAFTGYADALTVGVNGVNTTYDFETVVPNYPPTADAGGPYTGSEGSVVNISGSTSDPEGDPLTNTWTFTPGPDVDPGATCTFADPAALDTTISCTDAGVFTLTLTVNDSVNTPVSNSTSLTLGETNPSVTITSPNSGVSFREGQQVAVSANVSDVSNDSLTCNLDWGDGATSEGVIISGVCTASHAYDPSGDYTITVTVTDDDAGSATDSVGITVFNDPPTVGAGGPYTGDEGSDVNLDGTASDLEGDPLAYTWTYTSGPDVDPGATCAFGDSTALSTTFNCTDDGLFNLTLSVDDGVNPAASNSTTASLGNLPPTVNIDLPVDGTSFIQGQQVDLSAQLAEPGDNDTLICQVNWGDGTTTDGELVGGNCTGNHIYIQTGDYTLTATLTDDDGASNSDTTGITVLNVAPTVDITSPVDNDSFSTGSSVDLSADVFDPGGDDQLICMVDWGDGESSQGIVTTGVCNASHVFALPADYLITVTVTDEDSGTASDSVSITITNLAPTADAGGPYAGGEGRTINLSGLATDSEGDSLTYAWAYTPAAGVDSGTSCTFADPSAAATSLTCTDNGSFTLTFTVDDGINPPVSDTASLKVNNRPPVVTINEPADGHTYLIGEDVTLNAKSTNPGGNDTHTCQVNWGDGTSTDGSFNGNVCTASHIYPAVGEYTINVTITDDDGGIGSDSVNLTISDEPQPKVPLVYLPLMNKNWNSSN